MTKFKYGKEIRYTIIMGGKMPITYKEDIFAIRFMHNPIIKSDFEPVYVDDKKRYDIDKKNNCLKPEGFALSFYDTMEHAVEAFNFLNSQFHKFKTKAYNSYGLFDLTSSDGEKTDIDIKGNIGHFNFFEYKGVNLRKNLKQQI